MSDLRKFAESVADSIRGVRAYVDERMAGSATMVAVGDLAQELRAGFAADLAQARTETRTALDQVTDQVARDEIQALRNWAEEQLRGMFHTEREVRQAAVAALEKALQNKDAELTLALTRLAALEESAVTRTALDQVQAELAPVRAAQENLAQADELLAKRLAAHAETAQNALQALESRLTDVQSSAAEEASLRASGLVSASLNDIRSEQTVRFGKLQDQVIGFQQETLRAVTSIRPEPGPAGMPGRDARMLPPVAWETGKAFRFNDWVRHAGGLWHCYRDTDAEPDARADCGWTLVTDGITDIRLDTIPEDERAIALVVRRASGKDARLEFRVPSLIHRGQWREATRFDEGDVITHDGSSWVAKRTSIGVKPGTDEAVDDWMLSTKRGKNGINASAQRGIHWRGPWEIGMRCEVNDLVKTRRAIWICLRSTDDPPSNASPLSWAVFLGEDD